MSVTLGLALLFLLAASHSGVTSVSANTNIALSFLVNSVDADRVIISLKWDITMPSANLTKPKAMIVVPTAVEAAWGFFSANYSESDTFVFITPTTWQLVETGNRTPWQWQVINKLVLPWSEKLPCNNNLSPTVFYPFDDNVVDLYIGSNYKVDVSNSQAQYGLVGNELPNAVQNPYMTAWSEVHDLSSSTEEVPTLGILVWTLFMGLVGYYVYHVRIHVAHRLEVKALALGILGILCAQPIILFRAFKARKDVGNSNYIQLCLGFLLFLPFLLFTFRSSTAPPWITNIDLLSLSFVFLWAIMLIHRLWRYSDYTGAEDS